MPLASKVFVCKTLLVLLKPHLKYSTDCCLPGDWYLLRGVGVNCGQTVSVAPPRGKASILPLSHSLVCDAHASMWSSQCLCVVFDAARMHNSCVRLLCVAFSGTALCLCHTTHATGCWVFVSIINLYIMLKHNNLYLKFGAMLTSAFRFGRSGGGVLLQQRSRGLYFLTLRVHPTFCRAFIILAVTALW